MQIKINKQQFNGPKFLELLAKPLKDKIYATNHIDGVVSIFTSSELSQAEIDLINNAVDTHDATPNSLLRIFRVLRSDQNPLTTDFTILGFRKESPSYDRGKKVQSRYLCQNTEEEIVVKTFTDIRDANGILTGLQVDFKWYDEEGNVSLIKTEIVKNFNKFEAETEERKRRYRQFDYLRASVKYTPLEQHLGLLIRHYSRYITEYQDDGLLGLNDAMINETDPTIASILQIEVPRNDGQGTTTVIKSIQYQIGTLELENL